jgi:DNA modification methylase/ParB-like chromosome segregation protein Spo0J
MAHADVSSATRRISAIKVGHRHRQDLGNLETLAESLEAVGLLHPVVIDSKNRLIAGQRRLEAAKLVGWKTIPVRVVDIEQIAFGEFAENACRKDFTPSEIAAIARVLRPIVEENAHQRRLNGLCNQKLVVANCHDEGKTRDIVARFTGISGRTLDKITAIVDAADEKPALFGHLKEEMDAEPRSVHRCYQKMKTIRQQQIAQDETIEPIDVGRFKLKENEIVCGDCVEILPRIKSSTFHAVITDPSFGIGHVYNGKKEKADDPASYWRWLQPIYKEILRVLKPGGFCAIFQGGRYMRHFWDWFGDHEFVVYAACRQPMSGWKGGEPIACCWNPVIVFYKGGRPLFRSAEFTRARNWFVSNSSFDAQARLHPCPEPLDQCEELVKSFTCDGALVLDCFAGVGSIPIACAKTNRRFVGIEIEPEYVKVARRRLAEFRKKT